MNTNKATAFLLATGLFIGALGNVSYAMNQSETLIMSSSEEKEAISTFSYEELLNLAIKNSSILKRQQKEIERSEIMRDQAAQNKTYTPIGGGTTMEEAAASAALQGLVAADINLAMAKQQVNIEKDKLAYDVRKAVNKLILAEKQLNLDKTVKELTEMELKLGNIQYQQGTISQLQQKMLNDNYQEASKKLESSENQLENAYLQLNDLVGLNKEERYKLAKNEFDEEKEIPALETHIRRMLNQNPNIWVLEQRVKLADLGVILYTYNTNQDPYKAKEIDLATSKITLENSKQILDMSLRNLYYSLQQMQENQVILEINREKAMQNLNLNELKLEVGMATPLEVKKSQNTVDELEKLIFELQLQYEETLMIYEKPWVVSN